ncbi:MAG TPA: type II toxin-antitoxin system RelE/ParE family toxin [Rubrivivax sp.]|nr:type II toxin-antitoxin system RelE/ParE family toxin [Rubrivivax sp.]
MRFAVEFTPAARGDLRRLYGHLLERAETVDDLQLAERALAVIETAALTQLARTPFIFRKAEGGSLRRELLVPFGASGYVVLYEIADPALVVVLAVRHQREEDYH